MTAMVGKGTSENLDNIAQPIGIAMFALARPSTLAKGRWRVDYTAHVLTSQWPREAPKAIK